MKALFLQWLESERVQKQQTGSKQALVLGRAIQALRSSPSEYQHPHQLRSLKFFGDATVRSLANRMQKWCTENGTNYADYLPEDERTKVVEEEDNGHENSKTDDASNSRSKPRAKTRKRIYRPAFKSGGFAIIMALHLEDKDHIGMHKTDIIAHAQEFTDTGFTSTAQNNYSAWSSIKTLVKNQLVDKVGHPTRFVLTEQGDEIAEAMYVAWKRHKQDQEESGTEPAPHQIEPEILVTRSAWDNTANPLASSSNPNSPNNSMLAPASSRELPSSPLKAVQERPDELDHVGDGNDAYEIWQPGSYKVVFILDKREVALKTQRSLFSQDLTRNHVPHINRNLPIGDGAWVAQHSSGRLAILDHIFERKTIDDLLSSIKDNRFSEQHSRLTSCGIKRVMYLVEGAPSLPSDVAPALTAMTSMETSLATLVRTKDYDSTIKFISQYDSVVNHNYVGKSLMVLKPGNVESQQKYLEILESMRAKYGRKYEVVYSYTLFELVLQKRQTLHLKDIFIQALRRIRGVSLDKAVMIQRQFKTPRGLILAYRNHPDDGPEMLWNVFGSQVGSRKITKLVSHKVWQVFGES